MPTYTMDLTQALDAVSAGISQQDLADRLGVNVQRIRQARLDPKSPGYRPAPAGWQEALAAMAEERGVAFRGIASTLRAQLDRP